MSTFNIKQNQLAKLKAFPSRADLMRDLKTANLELSRKDEQIAALLEANGTDGLTGVRTKSAGMDSLREMVRETSRSHGDLAILYLDVNDFKIINDTIGHEAADDILRKFGSILLGTCRPGDIPVRYGGDEFFVIVRSERHNRGKVAAAALESRLKVRFKEIDATMTNGQVGFNVAIGISSLSEDVPAQLATKAYTIRTKEDIAQWAEEVRRVLMEKADANMYTDKRAAGAGRELRESRRD